MCLGEKSQLMVECFFLILIWVVYGCFAQSTLFFFVYAWDRWWSDYFSSLLIPQLLLLEAVVWMFFKNLYRKPGMLVVGFDESLTSFGCLALQCNISLSYFIW